MEKTTELTSFPREERQPGSRWARFTAARFNPEYFRMYRQIPLMLGMRLGGKHGPIPKNVRRILIVNNGLIGEFLTSLPAVRHLLDETGADIDLMVSPPLVPLLKRMRDINTVFSRRSVYYRGTEQRADKQENLKPYDCIVVLQLSKDSYRVLKDTGYKRIKLALGAYLKYGLYVIGHLKAKECFKQLEEVLFDILDVKKTKDVRFDEVFRFSEEDYENLARFPFLRDGSAKKIILHTGSGWPAKLWKIDRWVELLNTIHNHGPFQFIFIGGTEKEEAAFRDIARQLPFEVFSLVKQVDLGELALVMKHCHFFIGVDSGPRHLAHFLDLPGIHLLGPGPKIFSPRNKNALVIDRSECYCTNLVCFKKERCMDRISVAEVAEAFESLLRDTGS